jgi:hypothetical protein
MSSEHDDSYELKFAGTRSVKLVMTCDPHEVREFECPGADVEKLLTLRADEKCTLTVEKGDDKEYDSERLVVMPDVHRVRCDNCYVKIMGNSKRKPVEIEGKCNLVEGDGVVMSLSKCKHSVYVLTDGSIVGDRVGTNGGTLINKDRIVARNISALGGMIKTNCSTKYRGYTPSNQREIENAVSESLSGRSSIGTVHIAPGGIGVQHVGAGQVGFTFSFPSRKNRRK